MEEHSIYAFDDYREFLRHRYEVLREQDPSCTARSFAARAGFSNPGFLGDVIKGRRTLSPQAREKCAAVFNLSDYQREYFNLLVLYQQTRKEPRRSELYRKVQFCRSRSRFARLNPILERYYADYRYSLVYTALMACDYQGNSERLSAFLHPSLPRGVVEKIVRDLVEWKLVTIDDNGRYVVTERFVEPPPTLREQVRRLNREWIAHGMDALMDLPPSKRHVSTMLLSTSPATARAIATRVEAFREEIWKMVEEDREREGCVMQLNLQYFPRTCNKDASA